MKNSVVLGTIKIGQRTNGLGQDGYQLRAIWIIRKGIQSIEHILKVTAQLRKHAGIKRSLPELLFLFLEVIAGGEGLQVTNELIYGGLEIGANAHAVDTALSCLSLHAEERI